MLRKEKATKERQCAREMYELNTFLKLLLKLLQLLRPIGCFCFIYAKLEMK